MRVAHSSPIFAPLFTKFSYFMKSKILLLTFFITAGFLSNSTAQNADYKHVVSASAGLNVFQIVALLDNIDENNDAENLSIKGTASYGFTYDYGINNWFSLGGAIAYNKFSLNADVLNVNLDDGTTYSGPVDLKLSRTNIAVRPLFHYLNNGRVDLYSGFRLGVNIWSLNFKADEGLLPEDVTGRVRDSGAGPAFQIIPFGMRGYITPNLALGFETGFGAPHYLSAQLSYRLGNSGGGSRKK